MSFIDISDDAWMNVYSKKCKAMVIVFYKSNSPNHYICLRLMSKIQKMSANVLLLSMNVMTCPIATRMFRIYRTPTFIFSLCGSCLYRVNGLNMDKMKILVDKVLRNRGKIKTGIINAAKMIRKKYKS